MSSSSPRAPFQIEKLVNLIPVALKEAALDSPSFRASVVHFSDQIDTVERWLNGYVKTSSKLASELLALDSFTNSYLSHISAPVYLSESLLDPDYTALALRRFSEVTCDYWVGVISTVRNIDRTIVEPIRKFLHHDLKTLKDLQRSVEQNQKQFDHLHSKYSSIAKTKEPSSLREDAFQMHESRKAYLKSALDFALLSSQIKSSLDKLLVNVSYDQWRSMKQLRDNSNAQFAQATKDMERIKGWSHELTTTEKTSKNELSAARRQIEISTEYALRPSRELEDYSVSTVAYVDNRGPSAVVGKGGAFEPERQGWLNIRVLVGKPTRTQWIRRWLFLKNGTFGCLVQGARSGGVEESERIGVLLCGVRPAFTEERRFCFEVKTNNNSIMLQAETQKDLTEWIGTFEAAKRKALESPSPEPPQSPSERSNGLSKDSAFIISQPPVPEFAADPSVSLSSTTHIDNSERTSVSQDHDVSGPARIDLDIDKIPSRKTSQIERDTRESDHARDHAIRLIQKLDPSYRKGSVPKATPNQQPSLFPTTHGASDADPLAHNKIAEPASSFAPSTLVGPPAPTNLSRDVVFIGGERGIGQRLCGGTGSSHQLPAGMMANLWGSYYWGIGNVVRRSRTTPSSPTTETIQNKNIEGARSPSFSPGPGHRQTKSLSASLKMNTSEDVSSKYEYSDFYPTALRTQDVQFRFLFPGVSREESLLLVYRATFSPNDNQDFPGRIYVTTQNIYFYSNHLGLVCTYCAPFYSISEITGAPGRDCDFLYIHVVPPLGSDEPGRVTIKTYLEPLKLTQQRLNYLLEASCSEEPPTLRTVFRILQNMENDILKAGKGSDNSAVVPQLKNEEVGVAGEHSDDTKNIVLGTRIDKAMDVDRNKETLYFRLPTQPVEYTPEDIHHLALDRKFEVSTKALYHLLFGARSPVWRYLLYHRGAREIHQRPWQTFKSSRLKRDLTFKANALSTFGTPERIDGLDCQIVDLMNDHLCYVVTDKQIPWHLPFRNKFKLVTKVVITHVAKSRSKLVIYTQVEWSWRPYFLGNIIEKLAMDDLMEGSNAILDLIREQLQRPEAQNLSTKKALSLFGQIGLEPDSIALSGEIPGLVESHPRKQISLATIVWKTSLAFAQQVATTVFSLMQELLGWCARILHAHHVLVFILFLSVLFNGLHISHDASAWWQERRANKFFNTLAIRPSRVVSKAVYLKDIDAAVINTTFHDNINASSCFSVFHDNNALDSPDDILIETSLAQSKHSRHARNASLKLMRTRQRLGMHRHELLVALRVINSVERELIGAEWERWLRLENNKCRAIKRLLDENGKQAAATPIVAHDQKTSLARKPGGMSDGAATETETEAEVETDAASASHASSRKRGTRGDDILSLAMERFADRGEDVEKWYREYCLSCYEDHKKLSRRSLTAGFASSPS